MEMWFYKVIAKIKMVHCLPHSVAIDCDCRAQLVLPVKQQANVLYFVRFVMLLIVLVLGIA